MHVDSPTVPSSGRKGQKKGPDGLNRSCHMHKSHKDPRRMTCINAPDCLTAWCHKCVVKQCVPHLPARLDLGRADHDPPRSYLACTPNNAFEPSSLFLCPVCLDVCLCGSCKRKRSLSGRRSASADVADNDATFEPPAPRPKKKPRRTSTSSDVSTVVAPAAETGPGRRARSGREVRPAKADSDSSDDDASVSRLLTGAATTSAVAEGASGAVAMEDVKPVLETPAAVPAAPTAAPPAQPAYTLKVKPPRRRGSLDCAYDRANPFTFRPAPPSQPPAHIATPDPSGPAPVPVPASAPAPSAAQSSRRQPKGGRPPRAPRIPRPPVAAPAPTLEHAHVHAHGSVFAPTPSTAPTVPAPTVPAPTYNSRPIVPTAAATRSRRTKRPSTAFDDYALDSATSSAAGLGDRYSPSFEPSQMVATAPPSRKGVRPGAASAASAGAPRGPKRKAPRRYSGLSSASSCDELSSDDDGSYDDLFDDAHAVPMVVEEQPLPVLAGLEKNLEDGAGSAGESLTFDEFGLALSLGTAETLRARPRVKWIEGPERRRRRAMAAAAVAAVAAGETETSDAPTPERDLPVQGSAKSASPSIPSLSLSAPSESATPLGAPGSRAVSEQPAEDVKGNLDASQHRTPDDQPPPYDSHFAPLAATRPPASAPAATATPGDDLRSRSPTDAKLAFALLDAVRAAVAPRDGSSSSGSSAASQGSSGGFGAAIDALFGTSHSSGGASLTSSPVKRSGAASPVPSRPTHTDVDLDAATAEAERRRASLAAAAEVDPVKAFKPLAQDRADAQFFGAPAASTAGPLVEEEDEEERHEGETPVTSRRDADESATTTAATAFVGFDDVFEFEIGSPVDDLWTPASAADSVGASARSVSTAPSSAFDDRVAAAAAAAAVGVDDGGPMPGSASATPAGDAAPGAPAAAQACASPTRGLLADALAFGSGAGSAIEGMLPLPLPIPLGGAAHVRGFEVDEAPMEDVCAA